MSQLTKKIEKAGPFLRDIVFGVHDALLTNIGIVTGFVTALQSNHLIVLAVMIDVIISAFAMSFGTYLSRTSEEEYLSEQLHIDAKTDLDKVMADPIVAAVVMWFAYFISGMIPLIPFFFGLLPKQAAMYGIVLAMIVFFVVGVLKGIITRTNPWKSGLQFLGFGAFAALIGYLVGSYGQKLIQQ